MYFTTITLGPPIPITLKGQGHKQEQNLLLGVYKTIDNVRIIAIKNDPSSFLFTLVLKQSKSYGRFF